MIATADRTKLTLGQIRAIKASLSQKSLYYFARLRMPGVYTESRVYLRELCDTIQAFLEGRLFDDNAKQIDRLIINGPPRHGKTVTMINATQWALGHDPTLPVITASYNEDLSGRFARGVRDGMQETTSDPRKIIYSDVFPASRIKRGDASYQTWSLEGQHFSFLASSPGGTLTGTGGRLGIVDDLIKNAKEAYNESVLEGQWDWYTDTFLSRLESRSRQIIMATRWAEKDLTGRLLALEPERWHVVRLRANKRFPDSPQSDEDMLAPDILSAQTYLDRKTLTDPAIFLANYDQEPYDAVDKLYPALKTYRVEDTPTFSKICNYTDTADEGDDYLCSISYGIASGLAYVLDVIYTQDSMETTEPQTARVLSDRKVQRAYIESNIGGRGFARAVEKLLRASGDSSTMVEWFHQSENKQARILSNATSVCNCVIFPGGWQSRWPKFYQDVTRAGRGVKWTHDDAFDALTGVVEKSLTRPAFAIL